jgi:cytochrome c5
MIMRSNCILALTLALAAISSASPAVSQDAPKATAKEAETSTSGASQTHPEAGQRVFEQNCSRCHTAPNGFPPRISGTIAMHMRVRASLSESDMKALLRFLNP